MIKTTPLIQLSHVNKCFQVGEQSLHILKDIQCQIHQGEFISIMGPSGSGKSTLINIMGLLDHDFEGQYLLEGQPIQNRTDRQISRIRNQMVGFIFQSFNLIESMTVKENIRLPLLYNGYGVGQTEGPVKEALAKVGLEDKENSQIPSLSGGQKQRVAIARSLINQPSFIIADEPTGALDTKTSKMVMDTIYQLHQEEGVTVVMVTHDPNLQEYASRHLIIVDGIMKESSAMDAAALSREFNRSYKRGED